jgi:RNase P subunit RPR2
MRTTVTCQDCGARHSARIAKAVRRFPCLRCGWPTRVPRAAPTEREPSLPPTPDVDDPEETLVDHRRSRRVAV